MSFLHQSVGCIRQSFLRVGGGKLDGKKSIASYGLPVSWNDLSHDCEYGAC